MSDYVEHKCNSCCYNCMKRQGQEGRRVSKTMTVRHRRRSEKDIIKEQLASKQEKE
jgi:hypothetical protein